MRLGCSVGNGIEELKRHDFFESSDIFSWEKLQQRQLPAPYVPPARTCDGSDMGDEVPSSSPALSCVSWASFDRGPPSLRSSGNNRETSVSWDLNF